MICILSTFTLTAPYQHHTLSKVTARKQSIKREYYLFSTQIAQNRPDSDIDTSNTETGPNFIEDKDTAEAVAYATKNQEEEIRQQLDQMSDPDRGLSDMSVLVGQAKDKRKYADFKTKKVIEATNANIAQNG